MSSRLFTSNKRLKVSVTKDTTDRYYSTHADELAYELVAQQRQTLDRFCTKYNIRDPSNWYSENIQRTLQEESTLIITEVLQYHQGSFYRALSTIYPEHKWNPSILKKTSLNFWNDTANQRSLLDSVAKQLNLSNLDDWQRVSKTDLINKGGRPILQLYNNSLQTALSTVYPHHDWTNHTLDRKPPSYWADMSNQTQFIDQIGKELGIQKLDDWFHVQLEDIIKRGGYSLLAHYGHSLRKLLKTLYPERPWNQWQFSQVPRGFWDDIQNQTNFFEWFKHELGILSYDDWYKVTSKDIHSKGGTFLNVYYGNSLFKALCAIYPNYNWEAWKFKQVPKGFWDDITNQRKYFDSVGKQLGIRTLEDWYRVKVDDLRQIGNKGVLDYYKNSLLKALSSVYPEYTWQAWKFSHVPKGFWNDDRNAHAFLQSMSSRYRFTSPDEWQYITQKHFKLFKGATLLQKHKGLIPLLAKHFPNHTWGDLKVLSTPSKTQILLHKMLRNLFPQATVHLEFKRPDLTYAGTKRPMQLDIYIPQLSLAFEYQGGQHYSWHFQYGSSNNQQARDEEKRIACERLGITLVIIPEWWDEKASSLLATIHQHRPDVVTHPGVGTPIPNEPTHRSSIAHFHPELVLTTSSKWMNSGSYDSAKDTG